VVWAAAPAGWRLAGRWWWPAREAARLSAGGGLRPALEPAPASSAPLIALAADPHLWDRRTASPEHPPPPELAGAPLAGWAALAQSLRAAGPELTVVAGDLCSDADHAEPERAEALLRLAARAMERLPAPARALPGNHDARYQGGGADLSLWRQHLGPARQVFLLAGAAVVLLDTPAAGQDYRGRPLACGRISPAAREWLAAVLELIPAEARLVVVSHHPLLSPLAGANPIRRRGLVRSREGKGLALRDAAQGAARVLELVAGRRVAAMAWGHEHTGWRAELWSRGRAWRLFGLPAVSGGWWRGDRRLGPWRFAPGYLLLRLRPGGQAPSARLVELPAGPGR
jgi:hypothetical protein